MKSQRRLGLFVVFVGMSCDRGILLFLVWLAGSCLVVGACGSTETKLTQEDCQRVREHVAELRMANFNPAGLSDAQAKAEKEKHLANFSGLGGSAAIESCLASKSLDWVECSLKATNLAEAGACE